MHNGVGDFLWLNVGIEKCGNTGVDIECVGLATQSQSEVLRGVVEIIVANYMCMV